MRRELIPLLFALALAGCPQDTTLRVTPPPLADDDDDDGGGGGGGGGGGWPGLPELPSGPWGELDPGEMPDVHFVVAWTDEGCCVNCDGLWLDGPDEALEEPYEGEEQTTTTWPDENWGLGCAARYAVIDLFGQVIAELTPPEQDETMLWTHTSLAPTGPGRFMAASQGYMIYLPDPAEQPPEDGPIDTYVPWAAWEFDLVNNRIDEVARQSQDLRLTVQPSGRTIELPTWELHAVLDPNDPDWLYVWSGSNWDCTRAMPQIRGIHRTESGLIGPRFDEEFLLGPLPESFGSFVPRSLQASIDDEGNTRLFARMDSQGCGGEFAPVYASTAFDPRGPGYWRVGDGVWPGLRPPFAGWSGGGFLTIDGSAPSAEWNFQGPESELAGALANPYARPGPVLDPAGPTFALVETSDQPPYADSLVIFHGGQEVWRIDSLRFGLQERQLTFQDVIVLPPQVEAETGP